MNIIKGKRGHAEAERAIRLPRLGQVPSTDLVRCERSAEAGAKGVQSAISCQSESACEVVGGYRTNTYPASYVSASSTASSAASWHAQLP